MNLDRFTVRAAEAVQAAEQRARSAGHSELGPLHLLAALLQSGDSREGGIVVPLLEKAGANVGRVRDIVDSELNRLPRVSGGSLALARSLQEVFDAAQRE